MQTELKIGDDLNSLFSSMFKYRVWYHVNNRWKFLKNHNFCLWFDNNRFELKLYLLILYNFIFYFYILLTSFLWIFIWCKFFFIFGIFIKFWNKIVKLFIFFSKKKNNLITYSFECLKSVYCITAWRMRSKLFDLFLKNINKSKWLYM